jgi:hypothetical protein
MPAFSRFREEYLNDDGLRGLQALLSVRPDAGELIQGTGGLRKVRFADHRRGKGKRGGLRVIYYLWTGGDQIWLFTLYGKDEVDDISPEMRERMRKALKAELEALR